MALGSWSADLDYSHSAKEDLFKPDGNPRKLWMLVYDSNDQLVYPPLPLLRGKAGKERIELGGSSILWDFGLQGIGPTIDDREYLSDANKLDNPAFALDPPESYWRRVAENSTWAISPGQASNFGGLRADDALQYDRKFPARPGHSHRLTATVLGGEGLLRIRIIYGGSYYPPDLLDNGDFEEGPGFGWSAADNLEILPAGGRSGLYAMWVDPIPKPQLVTNFDFSAGADDWTLGSTFSILTGGLIAGPNEQPQYIADPGFETLTGWTDITTPPPMSDDIDLISDAGNAHSGSGVMRVGPVTQHQLLANSDFASNLDNWYESSNVSDPDTGIFSWEATDGLDGSGGATTAGTVTPVPLTINDQSTYDSWLASQGGPFQQGDPLAWHTNATTYPTFEANSLADPNRGASGYAQDFDGSWILSAGPYTPVPLTVTNLSEFDSWLASQPNGTDFPTFEANSLADGNRGAAGYIQDFDGSWVLDYRAVKYLRADSDSGTAGVQAHDVKPGEEYEAEAYIRRSSGATGFAYISLHIPHPSVADRERWYVSKHVTDEMPGETFERVTLSLTIPENRVSLDALFEVHEHSAETWTVDNFTVVRVRGNRAQINSDDSYAVIPDTRYVLSALVRSGDNMSGGNVRIGVILTGPSVDPLVVDVDKGNTDYEWTRVNVDVRAPSGYDTATPFVAGLDITGDPLWLDSMTFTKVENNSDITTHDPFAVVSDQRYLLSADVTSIGATRGTIAVGVRLSGDALPDQDFEMNPGTLDDLKTKAVSLEVRPPEGYTVAVVYVRSTDVEGGVFAIDNVRFTKSDNNSDSTIGTVITVTPERTYRWVQAVRSGANLQRGTVKLSVRCIRTDYDDVVFDSQSMQATDGEWKFFDFSFTPPSGYEEVFPSIIGTDVEGDSWQLDEGSIRDTDTSTVVFDAVAIGGALITPFVDATAPEGTESVQVAVIAVEGSSGRGVLSVSLIRTDGPAATGDDIIADLLIHPTTGLPIGISPGTIDCPETIPFDWRQVKMTLLAALAHYCNVISEPVREYRINPAIPPTIDVSSSPFVVRPIVLMPTDIDVEEVEDPSVDVTNRATVIEVIGAEVPTLSGKEILITASAEVPGGVEYDINDNPIVRTRPVNDATIDTFGYAEAYAVDQALREAFPGMVVAATLTGTTTGLATARGPLDVGDWIEVYKPESGIQDPANPRTVEGVPAFPKVLRAVAREREHGPSFRVEMLRPDGSTFDLPVNYSERDSTTLTLAERRLFEWEADPLGGAPGSQYTRDRASKPR